MSKVPGQLEMSMVPGQLEMRTIRNESTVYLHAPAAHDTGKNLELVCWQPNALPKENGVFINRRLNLISSFLDCHLPVQTIGWPTFENRSFEK